MKIFVKSQYTADISTHPATTIATYADDTAIISPHEDYTAAISHLQEAVNKIYKWTRRWKIRLNSTKSIKVDFSLRQHGQTAINIGNEAVNTAASV